MDCTRKPTIYLDMLQSELTSLKINDSIQSLYPRNSHQILAVTEIIATCKTEEKCHKQNSAFNDSGKKWEI